MPREAGLILRLMVVLPLWVGLAMGAHASDDCTRALDLMDRPEGVSVAYTAPCDPYAALDLTYGSLQIAEETDWQGNLVMNLPRLAGARSLTLRHGDTLVSAAVPPSQAPVYPFVAIDWPDGLRFGVLEAATGPARPLGFLAANGAAPVDLLVGVTPENAWLSVPITAATCAQSLQAQVVLSGAPAPVTLSVTMPVCDAVGQSLRIPLG